MTRPYDPKSLAERWDVSATHIRAMCESGVLGHFRLGKLYRIPANVVEEYENCQTSASDDSEAGSAFTGEKTVSESGISLSHARERKPNQRR